MNAITLFWFFCIATLVVFGMDAGQKRRGDSHKKDETFSLTKR